MESLHHINILFHVLAGSIALLAGLAALVVRKGSVSHIRFGRYFMRMIIVVISTGLIGVFVFKRNNFLLVITLLSAYNCFSGIRVIRLKGQRPGAIDRVVPLIVMAAALYYLYYISSIGLYWSPVIIYSTIGALFLVTCYDLCKLFFSQSLLQKASGYEHVYKMVSAFSAIMSAFTGTVFPQYQPYSQFLPSVMGLGYIIVIFIGFSNKRAKCTQL
ncbi:MAG TPA: hypothetical protein VL727_24275 [Puia sp.]|nr:hypothetical protein [Puia sp.]